MNYIKYKNKLTLINIKLIRYRLMVSYAVG